MQRRLRRATAALGAAAVLAVTGCGADQASTTPAAQAGVPGGAFSTASLKTLAAKLGVSTSRLRAAMEQTRPGAGSGDPTAALAKELDLSTTKVQAAMKAAGMGGGAPPNGAAPPSGTAPSKNTTQS